MGLTNNLCIDKTGTVTENILLVEGIWNEQFVF